MTQPFPSKVIHRKTTLERLKAPDQVQISAEDSCENALEIAHRDFHSRSLCFFFAHSEERMEQKQRFASQPGNFYKVVNCPSARVHKLVTLQVVEMSELNEPHDFNDDDAPFLVETGIDNSALFSLLGKAIKHGTFCKMKIPRNFFLFPRFR